MVGENDAQYKQFYWSCHHFAVLDFKEFTIIKLTAQLLCIDGEFSLNFWLNDAHHLICLYVIDPLVRA